jgi:L-iditol 2-dehydrogenase
LGFDDGAMLEPLGVDIHAIRLAKIRPGDTVAILGGGPIGLLGLQLAVKSPTAAVYLSEPIPERRALARQLGATAVCDPGADNPVEWLMDETNGRGVDIVVEAAWGGETVDQAVHMAKAAGKVILIGIPREDKVAFTAGKARRKGLTILMSRRMKYEYHRAIQLVENGIIDLQSLITHRFSLEQGGDAFELVSSLKDGVVKAMIEF